MIVDPINTINLRGFTLRELEELVVSEGEPKFRARQLYEWLYRKEADTFESMTTLSKSFREKLATIAHIDSIKLVTESKSHSDGTTKYLFQLNDDKRIESVLIPPTTAFASANAKAEEEQKRLTLCISTQVGCALDCVFCATASMGIVRNLSAGEIIDQVIQAKRISGKKITNLVYMGMGEPMMNYENVMNSIEIISTNMGIAAKRITVSTAGWAPKIRQMADENRKPKLAVSLHSLDDATRSQLMPVNKKFPLAELLDSLHYYYKKTKQRVTFEYILFDGINDTGQDIARLARLSKSLPCKVNIIPFHNISFAVPAESAVKLSPTPRVRMEEFVARLREAHVTVFVRSSAGEDIDAACGQLAVRIERGRSMTKRSTVRRHQKAELSIA
jgi:23S rRNA (adenine2503-C2)-methyltransferase